jgi:hypothetical protein
LTLSPLHYTALLCINATTYYITQHTNHHCVHALAAPDELLSAQLKLAAPWVPLRYLLEWAVLPYVLLNMSTFGALFTSMTVWPSQVAAPPYNLSEAMIGEITTALVHVHKACLPACLPACRINPRPPHAQPARCVMFGAAGVSFLVMGFGGLLGKCKRAVLVYAPA